MQKFIKINSRWYRHPSGLVSIKGYKKLRRGKIAIIWHSYNRYNGKLIATNTPDLTECMMISQKYVIEEKRKNNLINEKVKKLLCKMKTTTLSAE